MAGSLQDQLLKMGMVDKKKAKKTQHQKRQNRKATKAGKQVEGEDLKAELAKAAREKQQRDLALNKQRDQEQAQLALVAEVRQIVSQHRVEIDKEADIAYNFTHHSKIKKLYVESQQQKQLTWGQLAIAEVDESYYLIPDKIAERIEQRMPEMVVRIVADADSAKDDDPYADYEIPDDLMW